MTDQSRQSRSVSSRQELFLRYFTAILIDLAVLNLFDEYWVHVTIDSFTISMFTAVMLQVLLQLTLAIEHRVANYFKKRPGTRAKVLRILCAWLLLFGSKFVILGAIDFTFGDEVLFGGPYHGVVVFIVVIVVMIVIERAVVRLYQSLA